MNRNVNTQGVKKLRVFLRQASKTLKYQSNLFDINFSTVSSLIFKLISTRLECYLASDEGLRKSNMLKKLAIVQLLAVLANFSQVVYKSSRGFHDEIGCLQHVGAVILWLNIPRVSHVSGIRPFLPNLIFQNSIALPSSTSLKLM